jgi:hypothetical protein
LAIWEFENWGLARDNEQEAIGNFEPKETPDGWNHELQTTNYKHFLPQDSSNH